MTVKKTAVAATLAALLAGGMVGGAAFAEETTPATGETTTVAGENTGDATGGTVGGATDNSGKYSYITVTVYEDTDNDQQRTEADTKLAGRELTITYTNSNVEEKVTTRDDGTILATGGVYGSTMKIVDPTTGRSAETVIPEQAEWAYDALLVAPTPEEPKAEEPKTDETPKTDEVKPEEPKVEEPKADEVKPEEPKAEEPKTDEVKPEEPKTEAPRQAETKTEAKAPTTTTSNGGKQLAKTGAGLGAGLASAASIVGGLWLKKRGVSV